MTLILIIITALNLTYTNYSYKNLSKFLCRRIKPSDFPLYFYFLTGCFLRAKAPTAFSASQPSQFCLSICHTGVSVKNGAR